MTEGERGGGRRGGRLQGAWGKGRPHRKGRTARREDWGRPSAGPGEHGFDEWERRNTYIIKNIKPPCNSPIENVYI